MLLECDANTSSTIMNKDNTSTTNTTPSKTTTSSSSSSSSSCLFVEGMSGQLPIHVACRCNLPPESIQLLLDYDQEKQTILIPDSSAERVPLHIAYLRNSHPSVIQILLEALLKGRIERVGLFQWKSQLQTFITNIESVHERDFNTNEKLEWTCQQLRKLIESAIVLELVIWKANCLLSLASTDRSKLLFMKDTNLIDLGMDEDFKHECKIKSGIELIVPHVIAFVEDEPIVELLEQLAT